MRIIGLLLCCFFLGVTAVAADLAVRTETGRAVFRRGEAVDAALHLRMPAAGAAALELYLEAVDGSFSRRIGAQALGNLPAGPFDTSYRIDSGRISAGVFKLTARVHDTREEASCPLEIVSDVPITDFVIPHIAFPGWMMPSKSLGESLRRYHFNFSLANLGDQWGRGPGVELSGQEQGAQDLLRYNINFLKYPTVYGWGLAHRPIRGGASWYDPDIIDISAQLTQYHTQACRRFPNFVGLDPIDEPGVSFTDKYMAAAFKAKTGLDAPEKPDDRAKDLERYVAWQTFRNHALEDFNLVMKQAMLDVDPQAKMSCQTFGDILTREGLYPAGNTFLDIQCTHMYDHWPTSNNWISFDTNLRRANRKVFWNRPLWVQTGCYGIVEDQWRAAWALGMTEKLDGYGYFTGAGEFDEQLPWAEYSLAEITRINRTNEKYGNFFLALEKPVEPLALWYSLAQSSAADPARMYEQQVVGAYYALKRAHFPVTIVTDEDLRAGLLAEHKVLMMVDTGYLPKDLRAAIDTFRARGGVLVADRVTGVELPGLRKLDVDFQDFAQTQQEINNAWYEGRTPVSMELRRDLFSEEGLTRTLPALEAALSPLVSRPVLAGSPNTFVAVQRSGDAQYVFLANDASVYSHNTEGLRWITMQESVAATDRITMPFAKSKAVYDLFTGERITLDKDGAVTLSLPMGGLRVLCVYPREVAKTTLRATDENGKLAITATANSGLRLGAAAAGGDGVVPAYLEVRNIDGHVVLRRYVAMKLGAQNRWSYTPAINDGQNVWQVSLTNLLTGETVTTGYDWNPGPPPSIVSLCDPVTIEDVRAYAPFIKRKGIVLAPGKGCEAVAKLLADIPGVQVKTPEEIRKDDVYPDFLDPEKNKGVWMMSRWQPLALTTGADLVLLGTPDNNILIKDINQSGMLPRVINAATLGKGEGLVQYCWSPFDRDRDAVVISGYDADGLLAAAQRFMQVAGLTKVVPYKAPVALPMAADWGEKPLTAPAQPLPAAVRLRLPDGVRKLAMNNGFLAVGGQDGTVCAYESVKGAEVLSWQRQLGYRITGLAVGADGTVAVHAFPRTYVFDRHGRLRFLKAMNVPSQDDVEGMALLPDGGLVQGTWSGRVEGIDKAGKITWTFPAKPKENKAETAQPEVPKPLKPVREIAPLANGGLAVATLDTLLFLDAAGLETGRKPFDRARVLRAVGPNLLAASFKRKVTLFDEKGESRWTKDTPDFIMAADVSPDGKTIALACFGGDVLFYDLDGNLTRSVTLPVDGTPTGLAYDPAGNLWAATWDGELVRCAVK